MSCALVVCNSCLVCVQLQYSEDIERALSNNTSSQLSPQDGVELENELQSLLMDAIKVEHQSTDRKTEGGIRQDLSLTSIDVVDNFPVCPSSSFASPTSTKSTVSDKQGKFHTMNVSTAL